MDGEDRAGGGAGQALLEPHAVNMRPKDRGEGRRRTRVSFLGRVPGTKHSRNTILLPAQQTSEGGVLTTVLQVGFGETEPVTWAWLLAGLEPSLQGSTVHVLSSPVLSSKGADL